MIKISKNSRLAKSLGISADGTTGHSKENLERLKKRAETEKNQWLQKKKPAAQQTKQPAVKGKSDGDYAELKQVSSVRWIVEL